MNREFLADLLDSACPHDEDEAGIETFYIETHCATWKVQAHDGQIISYKREA